jgi:hypothetical protein
MRGAWSREAAGVVGMQRWWSASARGQNEVQSEWRPGARVQASDRVGWVKSLQNWFSNIQNTSKLWNTKWKPTWCLKIFQLGMVVELNILNNFSTWVDFKFPTEFKLQILE